MENLLGRWFKKYFTDPEGVILAVLLILGFTVVIFFGDMLAPVLASVVIAYLLEGFVGRLENRGVKRFLAVLLVFLIFVTFLLFVFFGLVPLLSKQVAQLVHEIPNMVAEGQRSLLRLTELYPHMFSEAQLKDVMTAIRSGLTAMGPGSWSFSLASLCTLFTLLVCLVLVPVLG